MIDQAIVVLTFIGAIGSGLMGGFFLAFSIVVMAALGRLPAQQGIAAMQSINVTVLNPAFFLSFFGTGAVCLLLAAAYFWWSQPSAMLILAASVTYLAGCIGVTMICNVPLNDALAAVEANTPEAANLWSRYLDAWVTWNHVRTVACIVAAVAFTIVLHN